MREEEGRKEEVSLTPTTVSAVVDMVQEHVAMLSPDPYYLQAYRQHEKSYWAHVPGWLLSEKFDRGRDMRRVLDIGCAYGTLSALAAMTCARQVFTTDIVRKISARLCERFRIEFALSDIERQAPPWPGTFDAILFTEVLEHLNYQPLPTLRRIRSLLAPDGILFLTTPDAAAWGRQTQYYRALADLPPAPTDAPWIDAHIWHYSEAELMPLLEQAGFVVVRSAFAPGPLARHFNLQLGAA